MEFHQTLQTHSYLKYRPMSWGPMLLELFPFVILNNALAFVYAYIWAGQLVFSDVLHFDTSRLLLTITLRGYLISIAYCLFFISVWVAEWPHFGK